MRKIKVGARRVWLRRDLRRAPPVQAQKFVIGRDELDLSQDLGSRRFHTARSSDSKRTSSGRRISQTEDRKDLGN